MLNYDKIYSKSDLKKSSGHLAGTYHIFFIVIEEGIWYLYNQIYWNIHLQVMHEGIDCLMGA